MNDITTHNDVVTTELQEEDQLLSIDDIVKQLGSSRSEIARMNLQPMGEYKDSGGRTRKTYSLNAAIAYNQQQQQIRSHLKDLKKAEKATENLSTDQKKLVVGNELQEYLATKSLSELLQIQAFSTQAVQQIQSNEIAVLTKTLEEEIFAHNLLKDRTDTGERYFSTLRMSMILQKANIAHEVLVSPVSVGMQLSKMSRETGLKWQNLLTPIDNKRRLYHKDLWAKIGVNVDELMDIIEVVLEPQCCPNNE